VYVADSALKVPFGGDDNVPYDLFYPWRNGTLNQVDYTSLYAVLGDLQTIWTSVIQSELEIEDHSLEVS
jgi:actin-related protein 8